MTRNLAAAGYQAFQHRFEALNLSGQGGLGHPQSLRCTTEVQFVGDREKALPLLNAGKMRADKAGGHTHCVILADQKRRFKRIVSTIADKQRRRTGARR